MVQGMLTWRCIITLLLLLNGTASDDDVISVVCVVVVASVGVGDVAPTMRGVMFGR